MITRNELYRMQIIPWSSPAAAEAQSLYLHKEQGLLDHTVLAPEDMLISYLQMLGGFAASIQAEQACFLAKLATSHAGDSASCPHWGETFMQLLILAEGAGLHFMHHVCLAAICSVFSASCIIMIGCMQVRARTMQAPHMLSISSHATDIWHS